MHVIHARNVTDALPQGYEYLSLHSVRELTRNGVAFVSPVPVATVYAKPRERVLFSAVRDANPFFHLMEGLWMIVGRGDAKFLDNFIPDFGRRFAEPDGRIHGAYGNRWRHHFVNVKYSGDEDSHAPYYIDQLDLCIHELNADPASRQVVLTMWDPEVDLAVKGLKDRPCNTHIYFRIRRRDPRELGIDVNNMDPDGSDHHLMNALDSESLLDMTVCCRSNDIILGAYGANAVHFSMLQEYVAAMVGAEVGTYTQVSNNYHMYVSEEKRMAERVPEGGSLAYEFRDMRYRFNREDRPAVQAARMVTSPTYFYQEAARLLSGYESVVDGRMEAAEMGILAERFSNRFLTETVWPMLMAHTHYKKGGDGLYWARQVTAQDWRTAAIEWLNRRIKS